MCIYVLYPSRIDERILFNKYSIGINNKRNKCVSCSLVLSSAISYYGLHIQVAAAKSAAKT